MAVRPHAGVQVVLAMAAVLAVATCPTTRSFATTTAAAAKVELEHSQVLGVPDVAVAPAAAAAALVLVALWAAVGAAAVVTSTPAMVPPAVAHAVMRFVPLLVAAAPAPVLVARFPAEMVASLQCHAQSQKTHWIVVLLVLVTVPC